LHITEYLKTEETVKILHVSTKTIIYKFEDRRGVVGLGILKIKILLQKAGPAFFQIVKSIVVEIMSEIIKKSLAS